MIFKMKKRGFTLIELLVVMAIIGILSTLSIASYRTSQVKGRDAQRKANLRQIATALEMYYNDKGKYPLVENGKIKACGGVACDWGTGDFTEAGTTYMKLVPKDPLSSGRDYLYVTTDQRRFQLFAALENTDDKAVNPGISGKICGGAGEACNFGISSGNTSVTDVI